MGRRRSASRVTDLLSGIVDDIKDFLDDEVIDRGRDRERDLRRTGRRLTADRRASGDRAGGALADLRDAVRTLDDRVDALVVERTEAAPSAAQTGAAHAGAAERGTPRDATPMPGTPKTAPAKTARARKGTAAARTATAGTTATGMATAGTARTGGEPWPGYDELTVAQIRDELVGRGAQAAERVRAYEQAHKRRRGVLSLTEPTAATA